MQCPIDHPWSFASSAKLEASPAGYERFARDTFGVSVTFGLYSIDGLPEWHQATHAISSDQWAKLIDRFNPSEFDADEWIKTIADASATSFMAMPKHHEGFCLYDSKLTNFTSVHSPFGRDLIAELAEACHRRDVAFHLYYSLIDWNHPLGGQGHRRQPKDFAGYCQFMLGQIRELCTNYGHIDGFLFDGWWPASKASEGQTDVASQDLWPLTEIYDLIHTLQPDAMVVNNHHVPPLAGEDYQVWEIDLAGENTTGFNCTRIGNKPLMAWITSTKNSWSWQPQRDDYKTPQELADIYARCRKTGASMYFNMGPKGNGKLNPREIQILNGMRGVAQQ